MVTAPSSLTMWGCLNCLMNRLGVGHHQYSLGAISIYLVTIWYHVCACNLSVHHGCSLQGILNALSYLGDLIVTEVSDQEHLSTLDTVLERLKSYIWVLSESSHMYLYG